MSGSSERITSTAPSFFSRSMSSRRISRFEAAISGNSNMPLQGRKGHLCWTTRVQVPASQNEQSLGRLRS